MALVDDVRTGARAVVRPKAIRAVVAAIATPTSTGLSAIAGRLHPIGRHAPGAVVVRLGGHRIVRVPIVPGSFDELAIGSVEALADGGSVALHGPGVLAYDGERERVLPSPRLKRRLRRSRRVPVPGADLLANVAAEDPVAEFSSPVR